MKTKFKSTMRAACHSIGGADSLLPSSVKSFTKAAALKIRRLIRLLTLTGILAASAAHAQVIGNGGFETGDLTDWTKFEPNGPTVHVIPTSTIDGQNADGNWFVDLGAIGQPNFNNGAYIEQP